jgi:hypothetical protein
MFFPQNLFAPCFLLLCHDIALYKRIYIALHSPYTCTCTYPPNGPLADIVIKRAVAWVTPSQPQKSDRLPASRALNHVCDVSSPCRGCYAVYALLLADNLINFLCYPSLFMMPLSLQSHYGTILLTSCRKKAGRKCNMQISQSNESDRRYLGYFQSLFIIFLCCSFTRFNNFSRSLSSLLAHSRPIAAPSVTHLSLPAQPHEDRLQR